MQNQCRHLLRERGAAVRRGFSGCMDRDRGWASCRPGRDTNPSGLPAAAQKRAQAGTNHAVARIGDHLQRCDRSRSTTLRTLSTKPSCRSAHTVPARVRFGKVILFHDATQISNTRISAEKIWHIAHHFKTTVLRRIGDAVTMSWFVERRTGIVIDPC